MYSLPPFLLFFYVLCLSTCGLCSLLWLVVGWILHQSEVTRPLCLLRFRLDLRRGRWKPHPCLLSRLLICLHRCRCGHGDRVLSLWDLFFLLLPFLFSSKWTRAGWPLHPARGQGGNTPVDLLNPLSHRLLTHVTGDLNC